MLRPIGTLLGWALGAAGILNVLHALGLNIQPLLAAGGVSGLAIGFGAQKLTSNILSGAKLVRHRRSTKYLAELITCPGGCYMFTSQMDVRKAKIHTKRTWRHKSWAGCCRVSNGLVIV